MSSLEPEFECTPIGALTEAQAEIARLQAEVERLSGEYERGVDAMSQNLWRFVGSVREIEAHEEHNDSVLGARVKALANADGKLSMTLGQSEVYVERIRDTAWNDAIGAAANEVNTLAGCEDTIRWAVRVIRTLKRPT